MSEQHPALGRGRKVRGKTLPISLSRQCVIDLMHFARQVPSIPVQKRMNLASLAEARARLDPRPGWAALFTKAYARVCLEIADLRRAYLAFPTPRLYEHPETVANLAFEREFQGGRALFFAQIRAPEGRPALEVDGWVKDCKRRPPEAFHSYRMARRVRFLPRALRRLCWWVGLNVSGGRRAREFGTFGVSVYSSLGVESLHPLSPLTSLLNYGPIAADGTVQVRIIYDHRVTDGATVARALGRLEDVLNRDLAAELNKGRGPAVTSAAA